MKLSKVVFKKEMHYFGNPAEEANISVEVHDSGGGEYFVINANEWPLDSLDELIELHKVLTNIIDAH
jgi:hypothetical protein